MDGREAWKETFHVGLGVMQSRLAAPYQGPSLIYPIHLDS